MHRQNQHYVSPSPWPFLAGLGGWGLTLRLITRFHPSSVVRVAYRALVLILLIVAYQWWRDIRRESTLYGGHTTQTQRGLKIGMLCFILREVIFFFGFFWAYYHGSLRPGVDTSVWPPQFLQRVDAFSVPILNTLVLLSSGATITLAHHHLLAGDYRFTAYLLGTTFLLGAYFTLLQINEYTIAEFSIADRVYGSRFYVTTGFHGVHVIIGSVAIAVSGVRVLKHQNSKHRHFGFEATAWYWHFVDVVWLALFCIFYWWGALRFSVIAYWFLVPKVKMDTVFLLALVSSLLLVRSPLNCFLLLVVVIFFLTFILYLKTRVFFRLVFFLVYRGGLIILFVYFIAQTSNIQKTDHSVRVAILGISILRLCGVRRGVPEYYNTGYRLALCINPVQFLGLAGFLFLTMLVVTKFCEKKEGPLRGYDFSIFKYIWFPTRKRYVSKNTPCSFAFK